MKDDYGAYIDGLGTHIPPFPTKHGQGLKRPSPVRATPLLLKQYQGLSGCGVSLEYDRFLEGRLGYRYF